MPCGKTTGKSTRQLFFSEAISQPRPMALLAFPSDPSPTDTSIDTRSDTTMEHILQDIASVSCHLEAMDSKITDLSTDSKSIWAYIAGFQDKVTDLDHHLTAVEGRIAFLTDSESVLQSLRHKLTDLEDRSRSDNQLFGIPEREESADVRAFLRDFIPALPGLTFSPALEFQ
ncbi:hypothetical protein NDU88_010016 [Pleurodeles waltl]|uniref:Uncharacterized protein n=1 Tax=Pleurodeles waltl TaxID=8319 RepID=A0AAV7S025_PLEWA|nr:hypothetical protein NDU88_010016 [Pleurodeles waltl]